MESVIGSVFESYCPKCEWLTTHEWVEDNVFEYAAICTTCDMVWQMRIRMPNNGILVDTQKYEIVGEITYDKAKRIDGMYYQVGDQVGKELIPAAYIFPIENRHQVQEQLDKLKVAKLAYDAEVARVFYKVFPTLR